MMMKRMYEEEKRTLPVKLVQEIMQDEICAVLPALKEVQEPKISLFYIALRDMDTQQEYMYPEPLDTLVNYQVYFLSCNLMKNIDFTRETEPFPLLRPPGKNGMGPVTLETFRLPSCNKIFQITVVSAPATQDGNITIFVKSPPLPITYAHFTALYPSSMERRACLRHYAMLGLALASNMGSRKGGGLSTVPPMTAHMTELLQDAVLQHGDSAVQSKGLHYDILSGVCKMYDVQCTAASSSLPLVLKYLSFLQFNLEEDASFTYHIMAPNKFSYMVHIPDLGGWEIYYQLNMCTSLEALEYAFAESKTPSVDRLRIPQDEKSTELFISDLFRKRLSLDPFRFEKSALLSQGMLEKIFKQRKLLQDKQSGNNNTNVGLHPADWDPDTFYDMMQIKGMDFLQRDILNKGEVYATFYSVQKARPLLQGMLSFFAARRRTSSVHSAIPFPAVNTANLPDVETILQIALDCFIGCVGDVWDHIPVPNEAQQPEKKAELILQMLSKQKKDSYLSIQNAYIPIILRACMECPPISWWERTLNHLQITDSTADKLPVPPSTLICTTFLFHTSKFASYFPSPFFLTHHDSQEDQGWWEHLVEEASISKPELSVAKEAYLSLCVETKDRYKHPIFTQEENAQSRRLDYCYAIAYLMLVGNAQERIKAIKIM